MFMFNMFRLVLHNNLNTFRSPASTAFRPTAVALTPPLKNILNLTSLNRFLYIIFNFIKYINFHEKTGSGPGLDLDLTLRFGSTVRKIWPDLTMDSVDRLTYEKTPGIPAIAPK